MDGLGKRRFTFPAIRKTIDIAAGGARFLQRAIDCGDFTRLFLVVRERVVEEWRGTPGITVLAGDQLEYVVRFTPMVKLGIKVGNVDCFLALIAHQAHQLTPGRRIATKEVALRKHQPVGGVDP